MASSAGRRLTLAQGPGIEKQRPAPGQREGAGDSGECCVVETKRERVSRRRDICANAVVKKRTEMSESDVTLTGAVSG